MKNMIPATMEECTELSGDELNQRLDDEMLAIERISILLEDAKMEPNLAIAMDKASHVRLMELLEAYETFLEHFKDTTEDTMEAVRRLTTVSNAPRCGECDDDRDEDTDDLENEDEL